MKIFALFAGLLLGVGAAAQTTQTVNGTVTFTVPAPIPGPAGPTGASVTGPAGPAGATGAQGPQGVAGTNGTNGTDGTNGTSPSAASVASALAATPAFVTAVATAVAALPPAACGGAPASTAATMACPSGTTGSWTQTTTYAAAPAGACTAIIVTPPPVTVLTNACSATSGPLTLNATTNRPSGIGPLLAFFDATGTIDTAITGNTTPFQDVTYTWNFGDSGASGTGTWAYGSNPGKNSMNAATGGIAAHLYVTGADTTYPVSVTASDGTNTASCQLGVTAYSPSGAHGFVKTTCVADASTPVPGSGDCPAGAAVATSATFNAPLAASLSSQRVLFHCGDTFTGDNVALSGVTWSVGAYGGCEGTQTNRPIFKDTTNGNQALGFAAGTGDGRVSDIDFEGGGSGARRVWDSTFNVGGAIKIIYQITLDNLLANGTSQCYGYAQGAQWGIVGSVCTGASNIAMFLNFNENNPGWTGNTINNLDYMAVLGNSITGIGGTGSASGIESSRISACRLCAIEDNDFSNANGVGAVFKLHNGNTNNSSPTWSGVYTELIEISDNWFGGTSGANLVENAPQNAADDERLRNIVMERNEFDATTGAQGGRLILVSAVNETLRDNVFYMPGTTAQYAILGAQVAQRGIEPAPTAVEAYNNTCYAPNSVGGAQYCIGLDTIGSMHAAGGSSFAKNILFYGTSGTAVDNTGTANTVSNNTATATANPGFTDASGKFSLISDFKPTANYSGGASVPVLNDAMGSPWSPTWSLGAIHP